MNFKTTVLQDLQQLLFHVSKNTLKKNSCCPQRTIKLLTGICISICKDVTEPSKDFCCNFGNPCLFVFSGNNEKKPAWTPLSYRLLILQHTHNKFSPTPVADVYVRSLPDHILLCIQWLLRTLKATNTVTVSSVGRSPLSVFPQATSCCPASKSHGDIILHSSNFTVSIASPLIKSFSYIR